ncbi:MAG: IS1595 family transposase [Desulfocapsa sp.]|nr:IS1595 family transposase [Desulfocapsa sp.]
MECFPKTLDEFRTLFHSEEISLQFLFSKRWPNGFECSYCNWENKDQLPSKTMTCSHCGHPTSITTDTIMHGTKKPLSQWLMSIWWLTATEGGHSAKDLQRFLKLSSYQTAWTWLQKLRMAMAVADNKPCRETVELSSENIFFGGVPPAKATILAAAEIILPAGITGRIKMDVIGNLTQETVNTFLENNLLSGSSLIVPNYEAYLDNNRKNFITITSSSIYRTRDLLKSFEIWLNKVHRGGVANKHLQLYLDEFCFRRNTEMLPDKESIFNLLLAGVISRKSFSYKSIISKPNKE